MDFLHSGAFQVFQSFSFWEDTADDQFVGVDVFPFDASGQARKRYYPSFILIKAQQHSWRGIGCPAQHDDFWGEVEQEASVVPGNAPKILESQERLLDAESPVGLQAFWCHRKAILIARVVFLDGVGNRIIMCYGGISPRRGKIMRKFSVPRSRTDGPCYL